MIGRRRWGERSAIDSTTLQHGKQGRLVIGRVCKHLKISKLNFALNENSTRYRAHYTSRMLLKFVVYFGCDL